MTYRSLPRYANSDLSEYRDLLFGGAPASPAALNFGSMFHRLTLELEQPGYATQSQLRQLKAMREGILQHRFARMVLELGEVEQVQLWQDERTGLPCKAQRDIWVAEQQLLVDLKTTSAKTYRQFLINCEKYNYDRQGAFYLDGTPDAKRFVILGVQKQAPFGVFYFEANACRGCLEGGRKKYQALLSGIQKSGFIPSSWSLSESIPTA